jgi:hypothetical protein
VREKCASDEIIHAPRITPDILILPRKRRDPLKQRAKIETIQTCFPEALG